METLPKIATVKDILKNISYKDEKLDQKQIEQLMKLNLGEEKMFSLKERNFILEAVGLINSLGFEESLKFLKTQQKEKDRDKVLKSFPTFDKARMRLFLETTKNLREVKVESYISCKRCKLNQVISWSKQTRRGDEGVTVFFRCLACQYSWRED